MPNVVVWDRDWRGRRARRGGARVLRAGRRRQRLAHGRVPGGVPGRQLSPPAWIDGIKGATAGIEMKRHPRLGPSTTRRATPLLPSTGPTAPRCTSSTRDLRSLPLLQERADHPRVRAESRSITAQVLRPQEWGTSVSAGSERTTRTTRSWSSPESGNWTRRPWPASEAGTAPRAVRLREEQGRLRGHCTQHAEVAHPRRDRGLRGGRVDAGHWDRQQQDPLHKLQAAEIRSLARISTARSGTRTTSSAKVEIEGSGQPVRG